MSTPVSPRLGRLATAMVVDSFGSGLFGPFGLLYAHVVVGLSLPFAGLALAVAGAAALALGPVAGALVDRFTAARVAAAGNLLAALGGGVLLVSRGLPLFLLGSFLSAGAIRVFWAAFAPLVGDAVEPAARERWFGLLRGSREAGVALGGLLASVVLLLGEHRGLLVMVSVDAASYLIAGLLIASSRVAARTRQVAERPSYRVALRDRSNVALTLLNVAATLLLTAPLIAMPVYVLSVLHQPAWLPGVLAGTGTTALAIGVTVVHRVTAGRRRLMVLATAGVVWTIGALAYAAAPAGLTVVVLFAAVLAFGLGEALYGPTADTLPLAIAPPGLAGRYTAMHQVAWGVSGIAAPALVGALIGGRPTLFWLVLAGLAAATAVTYRLLPRATHDRARTVGSAT
jgi:MFS family permease